MIRDCKSSQEDDQEFQKFCQTSLSNEYLGIPIKIFALDPQTWPYEAILKRKEDRNWLGIEIQDLPNKPVLPDKVGKSWRNYQLFSEKTYPKRVPLLQPQLGFASMDFEWKGQKYFLTVSTYVMIVLQLFGEVDDPTFQQLYDLTLIDPVDLAETLVYLSTSHSRCPNFLIHLPFNDQTNEIQTNEIQTNETNRNEQNHEKVKITVSDRWIFNQSFTSSKRKITLFP